jgi:hypothetical protein
MVVPTQLWAVLDYKQLHNNNVNGEMFWLVDRSVTAHGMCVWYDSETAEGAGFCNSPAASGAHVYRHAFFPWPEALELKAGDQVKIGLRADFVDHDYVWSWNTQVTNDSGLQKARYRQSTFNGAPLSRERLRKRAHSFVPVPNKDCRSTAECSNSWIGTSPWMKSPGRCGPNFPRGSKIGMRRLPEPEICPKSTAGKRLQRSSTQFLHGR